MPKELKEIRNFNIGTLSNSDSRDAPDEGAIYSNNVDSNAPGGMLKGLKGDILKGDTNWLSIISTRDSSVSPGTKTKVRVAGHDYSNTDKVKILGTVNSNGIHTISNVVGTTYFDIDDAFVSNEDAVGKVKKNKVDSYALVLFESGALINVGGSISAGIANFAVDDGDGVGTGNLFSVGEIIVVGTGVFKILSIVDNSLYTTGPIYGTLTDSAPFADNAVIYKTSLPVAVDSYLDISDLDNIKENMVLIDESGRIDGIEDFTSSSTASTVGAGINTIENSTDFGLFPLKLKFAGIPSIVARKDSFFIGAGKNNHSMWLGKTGEKTMGGVVGYSLQLSKLSPPYTAISGNSFTKIISYQFTTTNTALTPLPRINNVTKVLNVGFVKDTPFLYIIDGDTGLVHTSQNIGFNIGAIAKVVSCKTDMKVWVYEAPIATDDGEDVDIQITPGKIHCYQIFDLDSETSNINITESQNFAIGFTLSRHQTIICEWGVGGDDIEVKGYKSNPIYKKEYLEDDWDGTGYISDILETVNSSGNGRLWILASPEYTEDSDYLSHYFRGSKWIEREGSESNRDICMFRFIWSSYTDVDGDTFTGATSTVYFNDKSMPLHYLTDYRASGNGTYQGKELSMEMRGVNDDGENDPTGPMFGFSLMKRSIPATGVTVHTQPADDSVGGALDYNTDIYTKIITGSNTEREIFQFVQGGSFWYYQYPGSKSANATEHNNPTGASSAKFWRQHDLNDVSVEDLAGDFNSSTNHDLCTYSGRSHRDIANSYLSPEIMPLRLHFSPAQSSLVDLSDLYDGVDHVVGCLVQIANGNFLEDLWGSHYNITSGTDRNQDCMGYRIHGLQSKTILWTTNAGNNNTGALYTRSNSFGYRQSDKSDINGTNYVIDKLNLSTLCFDKTDDVVRNMKVIPIPHSETVLSFTRNKVTHEYNSYSAHNDNDYRHSGLFITTKGINEDDSPNMYFIRLNTTLEQGDSVPYGEIEQVSGAPYTLLGSTGSTALAGYANVEGTLNSDAANVVDNIFDNPNATDSIQQYSINEDAVVQANGEQVLSTGFNFAANDEFHLDIEPAESHAGINSGAGDNANSIVPMGPGVFSTFVGRVHDPEDSGVEITPRTFPFLRKIYFNGSGFAPLTIDTRAHNIMTTVDFTLPDENPLFLRSENFSYITEFDTSNVLFNNAQLKSSYTNWSAEDSDSLSNMVTGFSKYKKLDFSDVSLSGLSGISASEISELSRPLISQIWASGEPASFDGSGASDTGEYGIYGHHAYYLSLLNSEGKNNMFYGSIGVLQEDEQSFIPLLNQSFLAFANDFSFKAAKKYKESALAKVLINFTPHLVDEETEIGTSTNFPYDVNRRWKLSFEYDKVMEGPLSNSFEFKPSDVLGDNGDPLYEDDGGDPQNFKQMKLEINLPVNIPARATALVVYRQGEAPVTDTEGFPYNKVKEIQLDYSGWQSVTIDGKNYWQYECIDKMVSLGTYTGLNDDISETYTNTSLNYGISKSVNNYLFVSQISNGSIVKGDFSIARSLQNKYSVFDWENDIRVFKDRVTALSEYAGKLIVFTSKDMFVINPETLAEERYIEGFGCGNHRAVTTCEYGVYFANKSHAYHYDGQKVSNLSYSIETDLTSGQSNGWQDKITDSNIGVHHLSKYNSIAFVFEKDTPSSGLRGDAGAFIYHILKRRWDYRDFFQEEGGTTKTTPARNEILFESKLTDDIYYFIGPNSGFTSGQATLGTLVGQYNKDIFDGHFNWTSKEFTMGADTNDKRFIKLKIEASAALTTTPKVYVDGLENTLTSSGTNEWKIKKNDSTGASQKGKRVKIELGGSSLVNETITIYSMGIIYRRLKIK